MNSTLNALEFYAVLKHLASFCHSEAGRDAALAVRPLTSTEEVHIQQDIFEESRTWLAHRDFSLGAFPDISALLEQLSIRDKFLDIEDLWAIREILILAKTALSSLSAHSAECPRLIEMTGFPFPSSSLSGLNRCLADNGSLRDESSPGLILVRSEMRSLHQSCLRKVKDYAERFNIAHYLQDDYMTLAGDRYVLPLKANFKGRIQGIIHDYSHTGETLYFEPLFLVELNNRLQELKQEEREEERKVLRLLTDLVVQEQLSIREAWNFLLQLDVNSAKCALADRFDGRCIPMEKTLSLLEARHPLLVLENTAKAGHAVEPIDLVLREGDHILVISGGNAGGKTVALKTLGLIALMTRAGLPVPVGPGSVLANWKNIHAFIGDEQSLDDHVSTFTGQIEHLAQVWDSLDESSLLLLDEFGAGTDPAQGAALAQAVLDGVYEKRSYAIAATHFPALKTYALTKEGVRAASVLFDERTKKPLYRLAYDQVGASQALDVAREHGLAESILERASHYLLLDNNDTNKVISQLNALAVERKKELDVLKEQIEKTKEKRTRLQERFERESLRLHDEVRQKSQELMHAWKTEKITAKQAHREMAQVRTQLTLKEKEEDTSAAPAEIAVGQEVLHKPWNKKGIVQELDSKGERAKINLGGVSLWAAVRDLDLIQSPESKSNHASVTHFSTGKFAFSLDLRGKRADLAITELTQFLDSALLNGPEQVEIIHGRGTGALRKTVHEFLKKYPGIASYTLGNEEQGGDGMTIVTFR